MIKPENIKLNLWYSIKKDKQSTVKNKIADILNQLISENYTENEMKEIVMNCRGNLSSYLSR